MESQPRFTKRRDRRANLSRGDEMLVLILKTVAKLDAELFAFL